jgi:YD repeat-containing protein
MRMRFGIRKILVIIANMAVLFFLSVMISNAQSVNYYYDDLNRLIRIDYGNMVIDYTYDDVGNRVTERIAHPPITTPSPAGGVYTSVQSVTLTCTDPQGPGCGNIYYTTDRSTPTTSSPVYSSPIGISVTTTLKFFARDIS